MNRKNSTTTADYLEWNVAVNLVHRLFNDGNYRMSLLIGCGIFFGLRISDLLQLTWGMLLDDSSFELIEKKTQKRREVRINGNFQKHIQDCFIRLKVLNKEEECFISPQGKVYTIQHIKVLLKNIKSKYGLKTVKNFSSHSLRKTFGRHVYENASSNGELALVLLAELFNHSNVTITKRYLGIRREELLECYDLLEF